MDEMERARVAIDAAHAADPDAEAGVAGEVRYAHRIEDWVRRLCVEPSAELLLAARAQHLERWAIPRDEYPAGRGGYLRWRAAVHARQGERARQLLADAGCDATRAARVASLVSKSAPRDDKDAQALEDAACLVFLETEVAAFAAQHPREKTIDVLRKTWRKMSPAGQQAALGLTLPEPAQDLVQAALG